MKLSKREAKYRMKAIQEGHLTKDEQRLLDAVVANGLTYDKFYRDEEGIRRDFLFGVYLRRTRKAGVSAQKAADAMQKFGDAMAASAISVGSIVADAAARTVTLGCKLA